MEALPLSTLASELTLRADMVSADGRRKRVRRVSREASRSHGNQCRPSVRPAFPRPGLSPPATVSCWRAGKLLKEERKTDSENSQPVSATGMTNMFTGGKIQNAPR